ncbi:MAG TPA: beta-ketoacyl-ACP synthase III [Stellaceae bacterium]|nr:beta-ketoacyl-ACP synthase III [Stellaceae bacterium]
MGFRSLVLGCGGFLPERIVTNAELAERLDTSDQWIVQRTGIRQRHVAAPGEFTSDLAVRAAERALAAAAVPASAIDLVVVATATPDHTFPATATKVAARLGVARGVPAFDVQAVCTGFIYALATADNFLRLGQAKRALVIGAETFSRILDWEDRGTCVLFGDGAGAIVLEGMPSNGSPYERGVLSTHLHADGSGYELLYVDGGPSTTGTTGLLRMEGREIFRHAVQRLAEVVDEALVANGLAASEIDWLVPHQANRRIIDGMGRKLGLAADRVVITIDRHANTSAASVPLALAEAAADGRLQPGQLVLLEAMGGGLTWGAALIRW